MANFVPPSGPKIIEPKPAKIIYTDKVVFEVRADIVWCHLLTRHGRGNGADLMRRNAVAVLTPSAFAASVIEANRQFTLGPLYDPTLRAN